LKFEAVVGNPPYQEESKKESKKNGQSPRKNIFHYFQLQAAELSENSVLIFPGTRWMHQSGKGLKDFGYNLINNTRLKKLIYYPNSNDVFPGTDITDGVSIVQLDGQKSSTEFDYIYINGKEKLEVKQKCPGTDLLVVDPRDLTIVNKVKEFVDKNSLAYLNKAILPRSLFGIESDFIDKNKDYARAYNDGDSFDKNTEIKVLVNDKGGPGGRATWFIIDKNVINKNEEYIKEWQVVVSSAHPGGQHGRDNQLSIVDNFSAFGRSRVALKSFKTKIEAKNFVKYMKSTVIKFMLLMTDESLSSLAKLVPDVIDYTNKNPLIDFRISIDKQLKEMLKLTDEETKYVANKLE
jgi:hypothetical protein